MSGCLEKQGDLLCGYAAGHSGAHVWVPRAADLPQGLKYLGLEHSTAAVNKPPPNERYYRPSAVQTRIEFLERHRATILAHMSTRQEDQDWHGVSDDANDLREVDAELRGLRFVARQP